MEQYSYLSKNEKSQLLEAPALLTLLFACSNKGLTRKETDRAYKWMKSRKNPGRPDLDKYYQEVLENFYFQLDQFLKEFPSINQDRIKKAEEKLRKLNFIFPKLENGFAVKLYQSCIELAKLLTKDSGKVEENLPFNIENRKQISLPMIDDPRTFNV